MATKERDDFIEYLKNTEGKKQYECVTEYTGINEEITIRCTKHGKVLPTTTPASIKKAITGPCKECMSDASNLEEQQKFDAKLKGPNRSNTNVLLNTQVVKI